LLQLEEDVTQIFLLAFKVSKAATVKLFQLASLFIKIYLCQSHNVRASDVREVSGNDGWKILMRAPHVVELKLRRWLWGLVELDEHRGVIGKPMGKILGQSVIKFLVPQVVDKDPIYLAPKSFIGPVYKAPELGISRTSQFSMKMDIS